MQPTRISSNLVFRIAIAAAFGIFTVWFGAFAAGAFLFYVPHVGSLGLVASAAVLSLLYAAGFVAASLLGDAPATLQSATANAVFAAVFALGAYGAPYFALADGFPICALACLGAAAIAAAICHRSLLKGLCEPTSSLKGEGVLVRTFAEFALVFLLVASFLFSAATRDETVLVRAEAPAVGQVDEAQLANNEEAIRSIWTDWDSMGTGEKADALAIVARMEARYLGLLDVSPCPAVTVVPVSASSIASGSYREGDNTIAITVSYLDGSADEAVEAVCHEMAHAFQRRCVAANASQLEELRDVTGYPFKTDDAAVETFRYEFEHYVDPDDSFHEYINQQCELQAYVYGEQSVADIKEALGLDVE